MSEHAGHTADARPSTIILPGVASMQEVETSKRVFRNGVYPITHALDDPDTLNSKLISLRDEMFAKLKAFEHPIIEPSAVSADEMKDHPLGSPKLLRPTGEDMYKARQSTRLVQEIPLIDRLGKKLDQITDVSDRKDIHKSFKEESLAGKLAVAQTMGTVESQSRSMPDEISQALEIIQFGAQRMINFIIEDNYDAFADAAENYDNTVDLTKRHFRELAKNDKKRSFTSKELNEFAKTAVYMALGEALLNIPEEKHAGVKERFVLFQDEYLKSKDPGFVARLEAGANVTDGHIRFTIQGERDLESMQQKDSKGDEGQAR